MKRIPKAEIAKMRLQISQLTDREVKVELALARKYHKRWTKDTSDPNETSWASAYLDILYEEWNNRRPIR